MSNDVLAADAGICGICCVCCYSIFGSFCDQKAYGSGSRFSAPCGGPRGCCGSCFEDTGEDSFEKAERKERERKEKREVELRKAEASEEGKPQDSFNNGVVANQPPPSEQMSAAKSSS